MAAVHSWMRPDRSYIPADTLEFLYAYLAASAHQFHKDKILESIPSSIRKNGTFDPISLKNDVTSAIRLTDGELVDELEKRGWAVELTRPGKNRS